MDWNWIKEHVIQDATFWTAIGSIATVIGVIIVFFAKGELKFGAWLKAQEIWVDPEFVRQRGEIFKRLDGPPRSWSEDETKAALQVARKIDEFVRLAPYVGRCRLLKTWMDPLAKAWCVLQPIVAKEREVSRWPTKWDAFEKYGKKALKKKPNVGDRMVAARSPGTT